MGFLTHLAPSESHAALKIGIDDFSSQVPNSFSSPHEFITFYVTKDEPLLGCCEVSEAFCDVFVTGKFYALVET